jgi:fumarate hydratase subunit beta
MGELRSPLSRVQVSKLQAGETVFLTGNIFTARDRAHKRALDIGLAGLPKGFAGGTVYHCGPIMRKRGAGWQVVAAGPTTSYRMAGLLVEFVRIAKVRALVGKGGMPAEVAERVAELGCVYLAMTGGTAVLSAEMVHSAEGPYWEDLGAAESVWRLHVRRFGPLVVAVDTNGGNIYDQVVSAARKRAERLLG